MQHIFEGLEITKLTQGSTTAKNKETGEKKYQILKDDKEIDKFIKGVNEGITLGEKKKLNNAFKQFSKKSGKSEESGQVKVGSKKVTYQLNTAIDKIIFALFF